MDKQRKYNKHLVALIAILATFSSLVIAKHFPTVDISGQPAAEDILRTIAFRQALGKPWPLSRRGDTGAAHWKVNTGVTTSIVATGTYFKKFDVTSDPWIETYFMKTPFAGPNGGPGVAQTPGFSPLLIDLDRNKFQTGVSGEGVYFDILATGEAKHLQWVAVGTDDAFLVRDINRNGIVDDGSELFGVGTLLELHNQRAENGYDALWQHDLPELGGDLDGFITETDLIWEELFLWVDRDANGISNRDEFITLADARINKIEVQYRVTNRVDRAGNHIPYWSWVHTGHRKGPNRIRMIDIFFNEVTP